MTKHKEKEIPKVEVKRDEDMTIEERAIAVCGHLQNLQTKERKQLSDKINVEVN